MIKPVPQDRVGRVFGKDNAKKPTETVGFTNVIKDAD